MPQTTAWYQICGLRNWVTQHEQVIMGLQSVIYISIHCPLRALSPELHLLQISGSGSTHPHRIKSTVNCACNRLRLHTSYANLNPKSPLLPCAHGKIVRHKTILWCQNG